MLLMIHRFDVVISGKEERGNRVQERKGRNNYERQVKGRRMRRRAASLRIYDSRDDAGERGEREREKTKGKYAMDGWSNTTNCDNDDDEVEREEGTVYRLNDTSNVKQKPKDDYAGDRP